MEKIYGLYPGNLDNIEEISKMTGSEIYLRINYLTNYISNTINKTNKNLNIDLSEDIFALEYLIYQTRRFGVEFPEPQKGRHIIITDSFNNWFKAYSDYFNSVMASNNDLSLLNIKK